MEDYKQIAGSLLALVFIIYILHLAIKHTKELIAQDKILFYLMILIVSLCGVWVIDKVVASQTQLLSDEADKTILGMIDRLITAIVSYYMGTKTKDKEV